MVASRTGTLCAISAFVWWGLSPIYFKLIGHASPFEIISHRVIWSVLLLTLVLVVQKQLHTLKSIIKDRQKLLFLLAGAILIGGNWLIFIWAVTNGQILETSLGYFITPLVTVLFGFMLFRELLSQAQWIAVSIACLGVIIELIQLGRLPWIALILATSFACYGAIRKKAQAPAVAGLALETLILLPVALVYCIYSNYTSQTVFTASFYDGFMLSLAGVVTTIPLLLFTAAATRIPLSTLGFIQYIGPTITFFLAIVIYQEPLSLTRLFSFSLIWLALALFTFDGWNRLRKQRKTTASLPE